MWFAVLCKLEYLVYSMLAPTAMCSVTTIAGLPTSTWCTQVGTVTRDVTVDVRRKQLHNVGLRTLDEASLATTRWLQKFLIELYGAMPIGKLG